MKLITVLLLLCCAACAQTQYYVAKTGSDSNNGSSGSPWLTINHAATSLTVGSSGTVVNIGAGTYSECVFTGRDSSHSGTSSTARVVFKGAGSYASIVTCATTPTWTNGNDSTGVTGKFVDIVGMNITASGSSCSGVYDKGANFRALGNYIHDIPAPTSCPNSGGGAGIAVLSLGNLQPNDAHDPQIIGNIIENVGYADGQCSEMHGIYVETENSIVQSNLVSRVCGFGIQMNHRTTHNVITNNTIFNILNAGILVSAADGMVNDRTTVSNNIVACTHTAGGQIEERFGSTGPNNRYYNNVIYACDGTSAYSFSTGGCTMACVFNPLNLDTGLFNALFVNYTGNAKTGDYHLKSGSAAIGYGTSDNCAPGGISPCIPSFDFDGNTRTNPPSSGAYEFTTGNVAKPSPPTGLTAIVH